MSIGRTPDVIPHLTGCHCKNYTLSQREGRADVSIIIIIFFSTLWNLLTQLEYQRSHGPSSLVVYKLQVVSPQIQQSSNQRHQQSQSNSPRIIRGTEDADLQRSGKKKKKSDEEQGLFLIRVFKPPVKFQQEVGRGRKNTVGHIFKYTAKSTNLMQNSFFLARVSACLCYCSSCIFRTIITLSQRTVWGLRLVFMVRAG